MKYYDGVLFYNEFECLKLRCEELKDLDVTHIVVEANRTHAGKSREPLFESRKDEFKDYNIIYHVIDLPNTTPDRTNARDNETHQRNYIKTAIQEIAQDDDIVLISDVDEIPNIKTVEKYHADLKVTTLLMDNFYFWINCLTDRQSWNFPKILTWKILKNTTPDEIRCGGYHNTLADGGWHFGWLGGVDRVMEKFKSFSHQEEDVQKRADPEALKQKIENCTSLWGDGSYEVLPITDYYPKYLLDNQSEFQHIIKEI